MLQVFRLKRTWSCILCAGCFRVGCRTDVSGCDRPPAQLPEEITSAASLSTFQRHLKTFLFRKLFPDIIADWHSSGPCGNLNYLGHSKKFWLIDWLIWRTWINNQRISMASTPIIKHSCVRFCLASYQTTHMNSVDNINSNLDNRFKPNFTTGRTPGGRIWHMNYKLLQTDKIWQPEESSWSTGCAQCTSLQQRLYQSAPVSPICCSAEQNISTPWLISCQALTFQRFASFGSGQFQKVSQSLIQSAR